jgi:predicted GIY-YIG superfamily endonuclease
VYHVYRLYDENNRSYIGVSAKLDKRLKDHLSGNGSKKIHEAIQNGIKFKSEILFSFTEETFAYNKEKELIIQYDSINLGYNITPGGFGGFKSNRRGELNTQSILTEDIVLDIRNEYLDTSITQQMLADKYGVSRENISSIVRGKSWPHVGGPIVKRKLAVRTPMTEELIEKIKELRKINTTYSRIAEELDITVYYAYKYGKGVN